MVDNNYKVGIYVRLSREDEQKEVVESESIQNQKEFLTKYVRDKGLNLVKIYQDDGYTGTNFDRPGFKELLKDIEDKKINMVITKDLSRLGRDYITTGEILEKYFPENDVRFVAVNDNMDSFINDNNVMLPFKLVVNDYYARDISQKVRTTMNLKRQQGKYIGAFAPYGYKKDPKDKNHLIIDEEAAYIVNRIFAMYLNGEGEGKGYGFSKIANKLNKESILCPAAYKKLQNPNYNNVRSKYCFWTPEVVRNILKNPTYAGNVTQNKYKKINYKIKKLKSMSVEEWITVEDSHEAIVSNETFEAIQRLISVKGNRQYNTKISKHILSGLIFCGDCGGRMTYTKTPKGESYCICAAYKRFHTCTRHSIKENELIESVLKDLKSILNAYIDKERLIKVAEEAKAKNTKKANIKSELRRIDKRLGEIQIFLKKMLEDKYLGKISEEMFNNFTDEYLKEQKKLKGEGVRLKEIIKKQEEESGNKDMFKNLVEELLKMDEPDKLTLSKLIDKIEIYENKKIKIFYKFKLPF
ncbi:recombinase family protein [Clostridium ganghwense]|uniref:Recombinase family protein n=1 Tax=Clostridium ganghwense TaxID=312089 RepID=A0ABT4CNK9_9CLOT|nr:recombinase family protein [Clostridium ganghwense]MCY6370643.1 recombinase family protein [Clostridium ganghwense]